MTRVLLLHGGEVPHYRVGVYNHLARFLRGHAFDLTVASERIQAGNVREVQFDFVAVPPSAARIGSLIHRRGFEVVLMFVNMRHRYLFPVYAVSKGLLGCRMVWWGQGRDLADRDNWLKNTAYMTEHALCDAIILYAEHLRKYVAERFQHKIFVANNTITFDHPGHPTGGKDKVLDAHGISTRRNIICMGRLQKRKRIEQLVAAHREMNRPDVGLILVGPDLDGVLRGVDGPNVYKIGALYGDAGLDLLAAADVYCLPGAVGLSIVDAFHCGLPFVTEEGDESAEIAYLRHGENGFVVPRGNVPALAERLLLLLDDDALRRRFSDAARAELATNASMEQMCQGFLKALRHAAGIPGVTSSPDIGAGQRPSAP